MNLILGIIVTIIGGVTTVASVVLGRYVQLVYTIPLIFLGVVLITKSKHVR